MLARIAINTGKSWKNVSRENGVLHTLPPCWSIICTMYDFFFDEETTMFRYGAIEYGIEEIVPNKPIFYEWVYCPIKKGFEYINVPVEMITVPYCSSQHNFVPATLLRSPIVAILLVLLVSLLYSYREGYVHNREYVTKFSLYLATLVFITALVLLILFDKNQGSYQFKFNISCTAHTRVTDPGLLNLLDLARHKLSETLMVNIPNVSPVHYYPELVFAIDGISLLFVLSTTFIVFLCFLNACQQSKEFGVTLCVLSFVIEEALLVAFSTLDLLIFFVSSESILIPMYIIINVWGSRVRKIKANAYFFLYTTTGSFLILYALIVIYLGAGTTNTLLLSLFNDTQGFIVNDKFQAYVWWALVIGFGIKIPVIPLHIRSPEAHVEAPTLGSVLLAGSLLKLGGYGLIRYVMELLPQTTLYYQPHLLLIATFSAIGAGLACFAQDDVKRIVAYSSISHMNIGLLGLLTTTFNGATGFVSIMIGHGLISSGLFFPIGVLYDRYHTREMFKYGGLAKTAPIMANMFVLFRLANIAFPFTFNFASELFIILSIAKRSTIFAYIVGIAVLLNVAYTLKLLATVFYGSETDSIKNTYDLTEKEFAVLGLLALVIIFGGVCPNSFAEYLEASINEFTELFTPQETGFDEYAQLDGFLAEMAPEAREELMDILKSIARGDEAADATTSQAK